MKNVNTRAIVVLKRSGVNITAWIVVFIFIVGSSAATALRNAKMCNTDLVVQKELKKGTDMPYYASRSLCNLSTASWNLQRVFQEVAKDYNCTVLCGFRGKSEQEKELAEGDSDAAWGESAHNSYPARAVDVMPYYETKPHIRYDDIVELRVFRNYVNYIAGELGVELKPLIQLSNGEYDWAHFEEVI